jgi:pimeloyl-ACP methyl ester carboxylesterase
MPADTIVLIHGLWMTPRSWDEWAERYRERGHRVLAPAWPGMDGEIDDLRRDTSGYERVGITEVTDHYEEIIRSLDQPPIIIGHSFGGLVVQLLLDRGLGAAGVGVDAAPVRGVLAVPPSTLRVIWPAVRNPANNRRAVALTREQFHYAFGNALSEDESAEVYDRQAIPGPGRMLFQAAFANVSRHAPSRANVRNDDRAPLLLVAGGRDHVVPASTTRNNVKLYRHSKATTDLKEYPERTHYTVGQDAWEDVADYSVDWATTHAASRAAA